MPTRREAEPPVKFAILGAGLMGGTHAKLIDSIPGAELTLVVSASEESARNLASTYGARWSTELSTGLQKADADAIVVCTPSSLHPDGAIAALHAGKHVLIEKPVATTLEDAERLRTVATESGLTVGVVSQRRFQGPTQFIRRAIDLGLLGSITSAVAESTGWRTQAYYDSAAWRGSRNVEGGGALMNQGIHMLDLLIWFLGEPMSVMAHTALAAHDHIDVEDVAGATIAFESGAVGAVLATTAARRRGAIRIAVHGDQGAVEMAGTTWGQERISLFESLHTPESVPELNERPDLDGALRAQLVDFIDAIRDSRAPYVTLDHGIVTLKAVLAVYESSRTGRAVIVKSN